MSRTPVFRRISPTELRGDGYHYLTGHWMGQSMPLFEGQNLGVIVAGDGEGGALPVHLQAFHASGNPLTNGTMATIPVGKSVTYDFALHAFYLKRVGKITVRVIPEEDQSRTVEAVVETYPGQWAVFGSDVSNPLPTEEQIASLEVQTGQQLCADHRRFLQTRNGINYTWWQDPAWDTARADAADDFYTALRELTGQLPDLGLLGDATYIFGAGKGHPYLSYPEKLGDFGFYNAAFLRFGIPVGVDGGGNLYVQILDGARRGEVVFLDHEYHYGMLDDAIPPQLAPDIRKDAPDKSLEAFTADEFWTQMDSVGYALPAAPNLDAMIETLHAHHTALTEALTPDWRKK